MTRFNTVFGPLVSRRLGRSLGINNIPPKKCSYSCVYCQLGKTLEARTERGEFYPPEYLISRVSREVERLRSHGVTIDYLTFVPDGEPTLDENLGPTIRGLTPLGIPIAVITNGSLLWREDVRTDLCNADLVSVKVDTAQSSTWHSMNRPHYGLSFGQVMLGIERFAGEYYRGIMTETMLVQGVNTDKVGLRETAEFLAAIGVADAYLSLPTRPPACRWVRRPSSAIAEAAYELFKGYLTNVTRLFKEESPVFCSSGNAERDLLSIAAVHPLTTDAVARLLQADNAEWSLVQQLLEEGKLVSIDHEGHSFYRSNFRLHEIA